MSFCACSSVKDKNQSQTEREGEREREKFTLIKSYTLSICLMTNYLNDLSIDSIKKNKKNPT